MHKTCHEEHMIAVQYSALLYNSVAQCRIVHCYELQYSKEFLRDQSSFFQSDWPSGHIFLSSCKFADLLARARVGPAGHTDGIQEKILNILTEELDSTVLIRAHCAVKSVQCPVVSVHCAVCSAASSVQYGLFSVNCTVCSM